MKFRVLGAALLALVASLTVLRLFHFGAELEAAAATYDPNIAAATDTTAAAGECPLGARQGPAGRSQWRTAGGVPYTVITPSNYRPDLPHPLLTVYAPAGFNPWLSERYAGLTHAATSAGFVIVYVGSLRMSLAAVTRMAAASDAVSQSWCIDPARRYASGHSDGGTVATALAALPEHRDRLRALAVSGMGWQQEDFAATPCPSPTAILILHGAQDRHFPGFGRQAAAWWSACNRCTDAGAPTLPADQGEPCHHYQGCAASTWYCEPARSHWRWAGEPQQLVDFLQQQDHGRQP